MQTIDSVTIGDLMGSDHELWIKPNEKYGFDMEITDENGETIVNDKGINQYCMDSMADFCKSFLSFYEMAENRKGV